MDRHSHIRRRRKPWEAMDAAAFIIMTLLTLAIFFPFYNAFIMSIMTNSEYTLHPVTLIPHTVSLDNYAYLLSKNILGSAYLSSILITLAGTLFSMTVSVMMAYGFSRPGFPGKKILFRLVLFTMFFSGGLIPTYMLIRNLKLIDNRITIVLLCGISTYNMILMKSGFEQMPETLLEAARIDGAGEIRIFLKIMLPLETPILATFTLFVSVDYWNEWFWSMLVLNSSKKMTLQLMLRSLISEASADHEMMSASISQNVFSMGIKMAAVMVTMLPVMVLYPFAQKYFAKGLMVGAIKM